MLTEPPPVCLRVVFNSTVTAFTAIVLCLSFVFVYEKQEIRRRKFLAIDVWFSRCCRVDPVDGATGRLVNR